MVVVHIALLVLALITPFWAADFLGKISCRIQRRNSVHAYVCTSVRADGRPYIPPLGAGSVCVEGGTNWFRPHKRLTCANWRLAQATKRLAKAA